MVVTEPGARRRWAATSRATEAGFTLIEMLVVLGILAVAAGLMLGRGPMRSAALETRSAALTLAQTLRAARAAAIAADASVSVVIDPARHAYAMDRGVAHVVPDGLAIDVAAGALRGPGTSRIIRFGPDGSASGGDVLLGSGTRRMAVSVEWLTGRVSVTNAP